MINFTLKYIFLKDMLDYTTILADNDGTYIF